MNDPYLSFGIKINKYVEKKEKWIRRKENGANKFRGSKLKVVIEKVDIEFPSLFETILSINGRLKDFISVLFLY